MYKEANENSTEVFERLQKSMTRHCRACLLARAYIERLPRHITLKDYKTKELVDLCLHDIVSISPIGKIIFGRTVRKTNKKYHVERLF